MRIANLTIAGLLALGCGAAMAQSPVQQLHQDNINIGQLQQDVSNNRKDLRKDQQIANDQRYDLTRDRVDRNADLAREDADLAKGNLKGAHYWDQQRLDQQGKIALEKQDLTHTRTDIRNDRARIAKDVQVRNHDVVKRNKAAGKI